MSAFWYRAVRHLRNPGIVIALAAGAILAPGRARAEQPSPTDGRAASFEELLRRQERDFEERMQSLQQRTDQRIKELDDQLKALREKTSPPPLPPEPAASAEPFGWGDFTWLNGGTRQTKRVLDSQYFTPQIDVDANYTYSFNRPIDDTVVGSTALARNNELELAFLGLGGDLHIGHVRGRLMLQLGTRSTVVPRNDGSILRGQFDLATAYRYISEGYAGYHFDWLHGVNVDIGIFMSYVGLFSYDNFENWAYQPSYTSDNTPWFFNGARIQVFPSDRLKVELWIINGWQTYGKFNELPGAGFQIRYAPREWVNMVFNGYVGTDTQDHPGRVRFHSDNSFLLRYYNRPNSNGLSRAAYSITFDVGFEQGDGVQAFGGSGTEGNCTNATPCEQDFVSGMAYNRLWFWKNQIGWTVGGGFIHNPGRYLVLVPTGVATSTGTTGGFDTNPGTKFDGWDVSTTLDWMPSENLTFRLEGVHRAASVPYFAGRGGVTGPDGYKSGGLANPDGTITTSVPAGWTPDLVTSETRIIFAVLFRI
jgi:hypothetical protein